MSVFDQITALIPQLCNTNLFYLRLDQEIKDFTKPSESKLLISNNNDFSLSVPLKSLSSEEIRKIQLLLNDIIFNNKNLILTWDIKPLFSYFLFHNPHRRRFPLDIKIFDLKLAEKFLDIKKSKPNNFEEAWGRFKMAFSMNEQVKVISKAIHRPLSLVTLPEIETRQKLNHNTDKKHIYLFYKPEGQVNGRLSSEKVGDDFICPHTLSQESRSLIGLQETGSKMISLDYSHMEVSMLACVSQDALLTQINNENVDAYEEIYSRIFEAPCDSQDKRNLIKKIFLPIMYGEQAKTLSEGLSVSYQEAFNLIHRIQTVFKTAYDYLSDKQNELSAQVNQQIDSTGRMRIFDNALAARNFNIQSPSALICLEKLIELNEKLPVLISIHDEYVLAYKPREIVDTFQEAKTILTKPSQFYPNVKLHIKAKFGKNLKEMTPIPKKYYCA